MKLVKLNKTHHLYHKGFTWAFRFDYCYGPNTWKVEKTVEKQEGLNPYRIFFGKRKGTDTPYWVGFNQEKTATVVFLSLP